MGKVLKLWNDLKGVYATTGLYSCTRSTLNARLERAILKDYVHHVDNNLVARWRPYLTIGDDTPTINGLPSPSRPAVTTNPTP